MDALVTLSPVEMERLLITIESSQQVHRRYQFFLWSQGALQSFIPHDLLVICHGEQGTPDFHSELLTRTNLGEDREVNRQIDRLVTRMAEQWRTGGCQPRAFAAEPAGAGQGERDIADGLIRLGLGHALVHGAREFLDDAGGIFIFLRMPQAPGRRHLYFAEVLMPYLHTTLYRMLTAEKTVPEYRLGGDLSLSQRETEVIALIRDGKTNQQIAEQLSLSPLTVKNHVQNILRKLDVANRAQAVAKAVKARLISG